MIDESRVGEANFIMVKQPGNEKKLVKVKPPTTWPCARCGRPTRSHRFPDGAVLCHGCYSAMSDEELEEFRREHAGDRWSDIGEA